MRLAASLPSDDDDDLDALTAALSITLAHTLAHLLCNGRWPCPCADDDEAQLYSHTNTHPRR